MSTAEEKFREDLTAHLLEVATGNGYLNGILLNTPDLDEAWQRYAPSFYPDAVREFNGYPEFCLACAGYLGMAVAHLWDKDWTKYRETPYRFFQGERGFDDMDDHILKDILGLLPDGKQAQQITSLMQTCAQTAVTFIRQEKIEPQSPRAFYVYARTVQVMFSIGAAIELHRLGYEMKKLSN